MDYEMGQQWEYRTREGDEGSTLTVLRAEHVPGEGPVVFIAIDSVRVRDARGSRDPVKDLRFLAITQNALDQSVTLLKGEVEASAQDDRYVRWKQAFDTGTPGIFRQPVADIVRDHERMLKPILCTIVEGPKPDEYGNAVFVLEIGDRRIRVFADPFGSGVADSDFDIAGAVGNAISDFRRKRSAEFDACLREAGTRRRSAGNPPMFNVVVPEYISIKNMRSTTRGIVRISVQLKDREMHILIREDGSLCDDYDPTGGLGEIDNLDMAAAYRAALQHVFHDPEGAKALGLDVPTLELLWT